MALSTNIHPISTHRVRPRAGVGPSIAYGCGGRREPNRVPVNLSCQIAVAVGSLAAPRESFAKSDHGTGDRKRRSLQFSSGREFSDSDVFGQFQGCYRCSRTAGSHGLPMGSKFIIANANGRRCRTGFMPATITPGLHGAAPVTHGPSPAVMDLMPSTMARWMGLAAYQVNHNTRHAISFQPGRTRVLLLERALGRLPSGVVESSPPRPPCGGRRRAHRCRRRRHRW